MPKEVRYLLFSHEEVLRALLEDADRETPGRTAAPAEFRLTLHAAGGGVVATVARRAGGTQGLQEVTGTGLMAVILRMCARHRIPMPRRGLKRLEVAEGGLALTVTLDSGRLLGPDAAMADMLDLEARPS
jgi:hypothetical protein